MRLWLAGLFGSVTGTPLAVSRTYVWSYGRSLQSRDVSEHLDVNDEPEWGIIKLAASGESLSIDIVQRSNKEETSFCSPMLPVTISHFLKYLKTTFGWEDLKSVSVTNTANPRIAGCICYVRTMIALGVNHISGSEVSDPDLFCSNYTKNYIEGRNRDGNPIQGIKVSRDARKAIELAYWKSYVLYSHGHAIESWRAPETLAN